MNKLLALTGALLLASASISPVHAVTGTDTAAGTACSTEDAVRVSANPSDTGGYVLTCESGTWIAQISADTPTSSTHVTTKGYVDAAVAAAAGGTSGGGSVCYYAQNTSTCLAGFVQAPGDLRFYSTAGAAIVCCSSGSGSSGDVAPTAFDFPDPPAQFDNAPYTWTALQITGFDSATVSISGPGMEYRICSDSGCANVLKSWKSSSDIMNNNEYLQIRTTDFSEGTGTITVGDMSDTVTLVARYYAFVTSNSYNANRGGLSGVDSLCQSFADVVSLPGTYRGWVSTGTTNPSNRFENAGTASAFYLVDGTTKIADNWADLTDGTLDAAITMNQTGGTSTGSMWTGTNADGSSTNVDCLDWGTSSTSYGAYYGQNTQTNSGWSYTGGQYLCNATLRFYCFQVTSN